MVAKSESGEGLILEIRDRRLARFRTSTTRQVRSLCNGAKMATFNYNTVSELFPKTNEAELTPGRRRRREPIGYGRFARAADAIGFAMEELSGTSVTSLIST